MALASAVECTATVAMPSSLQARSTRSAISPRLAIRILLNRMRRRGHSMIISGSPYSTGWPSSTRISVTVPARGAGNLVHRLHRLDDQQRLALADAIADVDEGAGAGLGRQVGGADHRRGDRAGARGRRSPARSSAWAAARPARRGRRRLGDTRRRRARRARGCRRARPRSRSGRSRSAGRPAGGSGPGRRSTSSLPSARSSGVLVVAFAPATSGCSASSAST